MAERIHDNPFLEKRFRDNLFLEMVKNRCVSLGLAIEVKSQIVFRVGYDYCAEVVARTSTGFLLISYYFDNKIFYHDGIRNEGLPCWQITGTSYKQITDNITVNPANATHEYESANGVHQWPYEWDVDPQRKGE